MSDLSLWPIVLGVVLLSVSAVASVGIMLGMLVVLTKSANASRKDWDDTRATYMTVVRDLARVIRFMEESPALSKTAGKSTPKRTDEVYEEVIRSMDEHEENLRTHTPGAEFTVR